MAPEEAIEWATRANNVDANVVTRALHAGAEIVGKTID